MLTLMLDNKLYIAPIPEDAYKVIDLGCGTGIWSIDFADAHPEAEVIGIDLSPIQPAWVPPNLKFIVDDITDRWTFDDDSFDFVHIRCLFGGVADWPDLYRQIYQKMRPGGWLQQLEMSIEFTSDDGTVDDNHFMAEWSRQFIDYGEKTGRTMKIADTCAGLIKEAGFEDVEEVNFKLPVGQWPKDKKMKELGFWNYHYCNEGCEGWALYALVKVYGWSIEEAQVFVAKFRNELKNKANHTYYRV
jgi:SAM-dependent methyltransferase